MLYNYVHLQYTHFSAEATDTPTTEDTTDTDMTPESSKSTCDVLANLAKDAEFFECTADSKEPCDHVFCSRAFGETEYTAVIVLQPCDDPPSIRIVLSQADVVLVNQTIDHSQEITIPQLFGLTLNFTVDHFDDAIGLQVNVVCVFVHTQQQLSNLFELHNYIYGMSTHMHGTLTYGVMWLCEYIR